MNKPDVVALEGDGWNKPKSSRLKPSVHMIMFIMLISSIITIGVYHPQHGIFAVILLIAFLVGLFGSLGSVFNLNEKKRQKDRQQFLMAGAENIESLSPVQFEKYCGILLEEKGWHVEYTAATGDYGVDIIATRNGEKMVVQCKHYTSNVGVSAVQEIFTGKTFYRAQIACVVASRGGFTRSAKSLAERTGVEVLSARDLR